MKWNVLNCITETKITNELMIDWFKMMNIFKSFIYTKCSQISAKSFFIRLSVLHTFRQLFNTPLWGKYEGIFCFTNQQFPLQKQMQWKTRKRLYKPAKSYFFRTVINLNRSQLPGRSNPRQFRRHSHFLRHA